MKIRTTFVVIGILAYFLASCIREEAPNAEADITRCILPSEILVKEDIDYHRPFDRALNAYPLYIEVKANTNLTRLAPFFELTEGATITPQSGSIQDFSTPVYYTVISENKQWQKRYALLIQYPSTTSIPTDFHFEQVELQDNYYIFYKDMADGNRFTWASGNQGFALTGNATTPYAFPTTISPDGYIGNCAKLTTLSTGDLGQKVDKPIAAGNLFIGKFDLLNALGDALSATKFGATFHHRPTKLTGYFKYKSGAQFYENGQYTLKKDTFSIYALFFRKTLRNLYMDGHLPTQSFESPNMVALAEMNYTEAIETDTWTYFELPFDYSRYNLSIDNKALANGEYSISIVFASSKDGDEFRGAPGSTLMIDEVKLIYE